MGPLPPTLVAAALPVPTRRAWFASLAALLGASVAARAAPHTAPVAASLAAAPIQPTAQPSFQPTIQPLAQRSLLQTSPVAGFQYHAGQALWPQLRAGDVLSLVREGSNRYDDRAVRLEWQGHKLGYVPALDNAAVSQLLDRSESLDAVITQLREGHNPWDRIQFEVYWTR